MMTIPPRKRYTQALSWFPVYPAKEEALMNGTRSRWCADDLRAARGALKQSLKNSLYDYQFVIDELTYRIKVLEAEHDDRMTELDHDH